MQRKIARLLACPVVIGLLLLSPLGCTRPKLPMPVLVSPVMKLDSYQAPLLPGPELAPQAESLLTDRTLTARGGLEPAPRSTAWSASAPASGLIATPLTDATGWKVEAASEQVAHLGQFDLVGPTGLYWVAGELALFRWLTKETHAVTLLDTKTGQSLVLEDYKEIHSVSPGGRYALLQRRDGSGIAVVNTQLGTERWRIPPNLTVFEWLTDHEFEIYQSDGAGIANAETGAVTNYRGRVMDASLKQERCFSTRFESTDRLTVACYPRQGGAGSTVLSGADAKARIDERSAAVADPTGRWLALGYLSGKARTAGWLRSGVAEATPPLPPMYWADTLLIYDSETGALRRLGLPDKVMIRALRWSADSAYLGLQLHPDQSNPWVALREGANWVLEVATGKMDRLHNLSEAKPGYLYRALPGGELVIQTSPGAADVHSRGRRPTPWGGPGKRLPQMPPGPPWPKEAVSWDAFADEGSIKVFMPDNTVLTWPRPAGTPEGHVTPSPSLSWLAVQKTYQGRSGQLFLVKRP